MSAAPLPPASQTSAVPTGALTLTLAGRAVFADLSGALLLRDSATLVVADLHLEKGTGIARRGGGLLPPYDTRATLERLAAVVARLRPAQVVCLGDSFHDRGGAARLDADDRATVRALTAGVADWVWIAGNHDPEPPADLGGRAAPELRADGLILRHEADATADPAGEISGHYHPKARIRTKAGSAGGRCFVTDGRRLILPAFGAYAGGLDVTDPALRGVFRGTPTIGLIGGKRVVAVPEARLCPSPVAPARRRA